MQSLVTPESDLIRHRDLLDWGSQTPRQPGQDHSIIPLNDHDPMRQVANKSAGYIIPISHGCWGTMCIDQMTFVNVTFAPFQIVIRNYQPNMNKGVPVVRKSDICN